MQTENSDSYRRMLSTLSDDLGEAAIQFHETEEVPTDSLFVIAEAIGDSQDLPLKIREAFERTLERHFVVTGMDAQGVDVLRAFLFGHHGCGCSELTIKEAEFLFSLNVRLVNSVTGRDWHDFFTQALASHVLRSLPNTTRLTWLAAELELSQDTNSILGALVSEILKRGADHIPAPYRDQLESFVQAYATSPAASEWNAIQ